MGIDAHGKKTIPCQRCGKKEAPWPGSYCPECLKWVQEDQRKRTEISGGHEGPRGTGATLRMFDHMKIGKRGEKGQVWWQRLKGRGGK